MHADSLNMLGITTAAHPWKEQVLRTLSASEDASEAHTRDFRLAYSLVYGRPLSRHFISCLPRQAHEALRPRRLDERGQ